MRAELSELIDIHNHFVAEIDDGAKNLEESLKICQKLKGLNFSSIVSTVHLDHPYFSELDIPAILEAFHRTKEFLKEKGVELNLYPGAEHYYSDGFFDRLERGDVLPLGGKTGNYLLIEFPPSTLPKIFKEVSFRVEMSGYRPVLAHPERYQAFQRDPAFAEECWERGWLLQLDLESLLEKRLFFSSKKAATAKLLLENDLYFFAATDIHNSRQRTEEMLKNFLKLVGPDKATELLHKNPKKVLPSP